MKERHQSRAGTRPGWRRDGDAQRSLADWRALWTEMRIAAGMSQVSWLDRWVPSIVAFAGGAVTVGLVAGIVFYFVGIWDHDYDFERSVRYGALMGSLAAVATVLLIVVARRAARESELSKIAGRNEIELGWVREVHANYQRWRKGSPR